MHPTLSDTKYVQFLKRTQLITLMSALQHFFYTLVCQQKLNILIFFWTEVWSLTVSPHATLNLLSHKSSKK